MAKTYGINSKFSKVENILKDDMSWNHKNKQSKIVVGSERTQNISNKP